MLQAICIIFAINLGIRTRADIYTAVSELEYLLEPHKMVKDYLHFYIERHETRLATIKSKLNVFKTENEKAVKDITGYLSNPVNVFTLIKRLTIDLYFIKHSIKDETDYIENLTKKYYKENKYPTVMDLNGAVTAIITLQDVYNIKVKDIVDGKLTDSSYSPPMSACDCFELGRAMYQMGYFENGVEWIVEAYGKYYKESVHYSCSATEIIEYISFGYSKLGDFESSLEWIEKILDENPRNSRAMQIAQLCRNGIADNRYRKQPNTIKNEKEKLKLAEKLMYNSLCRGDFKMPIELSSRLTCRYLTQNHPFLKLAPFKIEMLFIDPDVVLFHDIMADSEIETVTKIAKLRLRRSSVHRDGEKINSKHTKLRISKTAWLQEKDSATIARISRRVAHMTGLSLATAEDLQIANYGIGGLYHLHYDFFNNVSSIRIGNRMATVLFYMSDVAKGGATVFLHLGLSVFPKKGAAIFWFNLHSSGEGNLAMRHAGCPVLLGSKWIATKWFHEVGQEFIRPCTLEDYAEHHSFTEPRLRSKHPGTTTSSQFYGSENLFHMISTIYRPHVRQGIHSILSSLNKFGQQ